MTARANKKLLTIVIHIAVWTCFLLIPFIFQQHSRDSPSPSAISNHFRAVLISSSLYLIAFYYFNTQLLIPKMLLTRRWGIYGICILAFFVLFLYFPEWISSLVTDSPNEIAFKAKEMQYFHAVPPDSLHIPPPPPPHGARRHHFHFFPGSYLIFILVFTIGTCVSVIQEWLKTDTYKKEIEREKLNTELQFLKSQVNPHFFFNTLNNIYSLAVTGSEMTAPAILKLSSIMRYIISDAQKNAVPLENEVTFIKHYIDLQLVRLTDKVSVDFTTEGLAENKMIEPLLFIPFVENAFKYGVSTKENTSIVFHLNIGEKKIIFSASNKIIHNENALRETTGIGINNVKRRLELLYPHKHDLQIFNTGENFSIKLEIAIK